MQLLAATLTKVALLGITLTMAAPGVVAQPAPQTPPASSPPPDGSLSDQLDRTDGVIPAPPVGDAEMRLEPPATGSDMPVIPPPGTPGNQPRVQPE